MQSAKTITFSSAHLLWIPVVLMLGILVGGWGPREDLRKTRQAMREMQEENKKAGENSSRLGAFAQMMNIPDVAKDRPHKPGPQRPSASVSIGRNDALATNALAATDKPAIGLTNRPPIIVKAETSRQPPLPKDLRARIDEAKELWKTRVDIARAQWIQRLGLAEGQEQGLDDALNAMNEKLYGQFQSLADMLEAGEQVTPESGMKMINEITGTLSDTYDQIASAVPTEKRSEVSQMTLTDFIDPGVAEPLVGVQDKLDNAKSVFHPGEGRK